MSCRVRIPQYKDLKTAIDLYIKRTELSNADIETLFGHLSKDKMAKLKSLARDQMVEDCYPSWNASYVNTEAAYKAWGLDINDLKRRYRELREFE